jgi:hypothetical protein
MRIHRDVLKRENAPPMGFKRLRDGEAADKLREECVGRKKALELTMCILYQQGKVYILDPSHKQTRHRPNDCPVYSCHDRRIPRAVPERKAQERNIHENGNHVRVTRGPGLRMPVRGSRVPVQGAHGTGPTGRNGNGCFAVGSRNQGRANLSVGARSRPRLEEDRPARSWNGTKQQIVVCAGAKQEENLCMPGLRIFCTIVRSLERTGGIERAHGAGNGVRKPDMCRAMPKISLCDTPIEIH